MHIVNQKKEEYQISCQDRDKKECNGQFSQEYSKKYLKRAENLSGGLQR